MSDGQILKISYNRVTDSEIIELTVDNCEEYGYIATTIVDEETGYTITVFYKENDTFENIVPYEIDEDTQQAITEVEMKYYTYYEHIAPPCSKFDVSYADVDKEGSGRNENNGLMYRERVGYYVSVDLAWDLIPNTVEYNNWYRILTQLPIEFMADILMPNGNIERIRMYRGDISTKLYLFTKNKKIWQGLSTTFIQFDVTPYDDSIEPKLLEVI